MNFCFFLFNVVVDKSLSNRMDLYVWLDLFIDMDEDVFEDVIFFDW